jgi:pimeloyl-ACP methyl ester carboxylesterase
MKQHRRRFGTVTYGTVEIAVCVDGSGAPLVVLPSFGRDGLDDFDLFTDLMTASGWRVLRPQPRGIVGSVGPMSAVDLQDLARDVAHVVRALAGGPVVLLGHAFGNFLARVVALEDPDLVRGVVLAAASARKVAPDVNETPFIAGDPGRPEQERLDALTKAFFAPGHDPRPWLDGWYPATLAMQRAAVEATDVARYWDSGKAPLLEIIPQFDPFKPPESWGELAQRAGERVSTIVVDDAAHALFPEQPRKVAEAVGAWSKRL